MDDIRSDIINIIGWQAETCLPDEKPVIAYYTDRHLNPILDELVKYVESVRADERERIAQEIERYDAEVCDLLGAPCTCDAAVRIARGDTPTRDQ